MVTEGVEAGISKSYLGMQKTRPVEQGEEKKQGTLINPSRTRKKPVKCKGNIKILDFICVCKKK